MRKPDHRAGLGRRGQFEFFDEILRDENSALGIGVEDAFDALRHRLGVGAQVETFAEILDAHRKGVVFELEFKRLI